MELHSIEIYDLTSELRQHSAIKYVANAFIIVRRVETTKSVAEQNLNLAIEIDIEEKVEWEISYTVAHERF
jgi:hypothetical protein